MKCKHCNAELEENANFCPACGELIQQEAPAEENSVEAPAEENSVEAPAEEISVEAPAEENPVEAPAEENPVEAPAEENPVEAPAEEISVEAPAEEISVEAPAKKEKKAKKPMGKGPKIIIAISLALVLLLGLATLSLYAFGFSFDHWENDKDVKDRYTAPNFLAQLSADTVVATLGDQQLTNGMLQMYYGRQLWDLVEEYGNSLAYLGLDLSKPLSEQEFPYMENTTWEQALLDMAIDAWQQQQTLVSMAQEEEFRYPEGLQEFLDAMDDKLDQQAVQNGLKDGNALVKKEMGANTDVALYRDYSEIYNKALEYYAALYESMEPDEQQVEEYFDEHSEEIRQQYGVIKTPNPVIDVRHILLIPEGGTVDEATGQTVYSEEELAACRQKAEDLLAQWKAGAATEESFAQLANEHSQDPGSNTVGGLYEYVYPGDMVETFDAWCFAENRQPGDTGLVYTPFGYHIMYFVYGADEWQRVAYQSMCGSMCQNMINASAERYGLQVYYHKIVLSSIDFE